MKIVADSNILFVEDAFKGLGEIVLYKTRIEDKSVLKYADVLLCRSTMKINADLLEGSGIKFVATATSGTEHFNTEYLKSKNIKYADAKGSNSNSVAEYVLAALLRLAVKNGFSLNGKSIGIIGWGCVGKKVEQKAKALGMRVLINDPPLEDEGVAGTFQSLNDVLMCDIITLHVPMIKTGKYRTLDMIDEAKFSEMKPGAILINASRGKVIKEKAMMDAIISRKISHTVIDVWYDEPNINIDLMKHVDIATPHIAGHSFDGKVLGTAMILKAFCEYYNIDKVWDYHKLLPPTEADKIGVAGDKVSEEIFDSVIRKIYDIEYDDELFRKISNEADIRKYFDSLRGNYKIRREFYNINVICESENLKDKFKLIGFKVK